MVKSMELLPTKENILMTLCEDLLDRNKEIANFLSFLNSFDTSQSICIDAPWGSGKTFFVKQTKMAIEAFNPDVTTFTEEEKKKIENAINKVAKYEVALQPQVCVYYDAWANDNDVDPILSIAYEIIQSLVQDYSFKEGPDLVKVFSSILDLFSGGKIGSLLTTLTQSEDLLETINEQKDAYQRIAELFEIALAEKGNRLIIFVDELDRCKPSFAVQLLERIKHYFIHDDVTFVFSINGRELQHTIKQFYGTFDCSIK